MKAGEFFINLGIKGAEKTMGALSSMKTGVSDLTSTSLAAKAAILAMVYALDRLLDSSAKTGTEMVNFNALTGIPMKTLQQYQYAANLVGIANQDMAGSFKSVQNVMTAMKFGKGAPEGMQFLIQALKGNFDVERAKTDIPYVMKKLQEGLPKITDLGQRNLVGKSFGLSESVLAGMSRNAFDPKILDKAPVISDEVIKKTDQVTAAFARLENQIKRAMMLFTAKFGQGLVTDFSKIVEAILKLATALMKLSEAVHVMDLMKKSFEGLALIVDGIATGVDKISGFFKSPEKRKEVVGDTKEFVTQIPSVLGAMFDDLAEHLVGNNSLLPAPAGGPQVLPKVFGPQPAPSPIKMFLPPNVPQSALSPQNVIAPKVASALTSQKAVIQHNNVNQTLNFQHEGKNSKQVGSDVQKAITQAYFQINQGGF